MAKETKKIRTIAICAIILVVSLISNVKIIKENYSKNNLEWKTYLQSQIQEGDIILYTSAINGAVISTEMYDECNNKSYFYNNENWPVKESYKSFLPFMEVKESLDEVLNNYKGRIWLVQGLNDNNLKNEIQQKYNITEVEKKEFLREYKNYTFSLELIEKN